jgi:hypothetical protein
MQDRPALLPPSTKAPLEDLRATRHEAPAPVEAGGALVELKQHQNLPLTIKYELVGMAGPFDPSVRIAWARSDLWRDHNLRGFISSTGQPKSDGPEHEFGKQILDTPDMTGEMEETVARGGQYYFSFFIPRQYRSQGFCGFSSRSSPTDAPAS